MDTAMKMFFHNKSSRNLLYTLALVLMVGTAVFFGFWLSRTLRIAGMSPTTIVFLIFFLNSLGILILGTIFYFVFENHNYSEPPSSSRLPTLPRNKALSPKASSHVTTEQVSASFQKNAPLSLKHPPSAENSLALVEKEKTSLPPKERHETEAFQNQYREMCRKREALTKLITQSKKQIESLEDGMIDRMNRITSRSITSLVKAKRIVNALEVRLVEVDSYLAFPSRVNLAHAEQSYKKDLAVPHDSFSSVINAIPIPPLSPSAWEPALHELLGHLVSKKDLFHLRTVSN